MKLSTNGAGPYEPAPGQVPGHWYWLICRTCRTGQTLDTLYGDMTDEQREVFADMVNFRDSVVVILDGQTPLSK